MLRASQHRPAMPLLTWLTMATAAFAELPWHRLDAISPAGARQGTKPTIRCLGADLENTDRLWCSHPGITGRRVPGASPSDHSFEVTIGSDVPPGLFDL